MSDLSPNLIPAETPAPKYLSGLRTVLRDVMSRPSGAIGLSLVVFHVLLALTSPLYVPYDFKTMNSMLMLMPPSLLGELTDPNPPKSHARFQYLPRSPSL